jgi:NAD(P)-dependent dehydrogenase (short-subunit alcohol dehydrogenase family)
MNAARFYVKVAGRMRRRVGNGKAKQTMNAFDLTGKVAVVTGGNGGIGLGIAAGLAEAGCAVHIWGRNGEKNAHALEVLRGKGARAESAICDVSDRSSVDAAFAHALAAFGRVDGCFANAGIYGTAPRSFLDRPLDEWRRVLTTNLEGAFNTLQAASRHMVERSRRGDAGGRLVVTSSLASLFGTARNEHYAASKAALNALARALAVEFARYGITSNAILPGWIVTEMTEAAFANERFTDAVKPRIPMRRFGEPRDFGGIAVYVMSDASAYHTGDLFVIDGGYTLF